MIYELNHVGMFVEDAERSIDFYTRVLGARLVLDVELGPARILYMQLADGLIEMGSFKDPGGRKFGYDHLAFLTDTLEADYASLVQAGFTSLEPPRATLLSTGLLCFMSDPNGLRVELLQRKDEYRIPAITGGVIKSFDHIAVTAPDPGAAEAFYSVYLSMEPMQRAGTGTMSAVRLNLGREAVELQHDFGQKDELAGRISHLGLLVDQLETAVARLQDKGVPFAPEDLPQPQTAPGALRRSAAFHGPDGERFVLVERAGL